MGVPCPARAHTHPLSSCSRSLARSSRPFVCERMDPLNLNPEAEVFKPVTTSSSADREAMRSSQHTQDSIVQAPGAPSPAQTVKHIRAVGNQQQQQQQQLGQPQQQVQHPMQAVSIISQPAHQFGSDGSVQNTPMLVLCQWPQPNPESDPYAVPSLPSSTPVFVPTSSGSSSSSSFRLGQPSLPHSQQQVFQVVPPQPPPPTSSNLASQQSANGQAPSQVLLRVTCVQNSDQSCNNSVHMTIS